MKKAWKHDELSDTLCVCGKALKARVVFWKEPQNARKCYRCYSEIRYHGSPRLCVASHKTAMGR